jgi:hypothetical protein
MHCSWRINNTVALKKIVLSRNMLVRGKWEGNAQFNAETLWEMRLKALGDHLSSTERALALFGKCPKSIGELFINAFTVAETFWEMPKLKWRPSGAFPTRSSANRKQEDPLAYHPAGLHIF